MSGSVHSGLFYKSLLGRKQALIMVFYGAITLASTLPEPFDIKQAGMTAPIFDQLCFVGVFTPIETLGRLTPQF